MSGMNAVSEPGSMPRIGPYELLRRIGVGAMASVYLARLRGEEGFTRIYALKVMHRNLTNQPELVDMLMDEARLAARISHPNVVGTVALGEADGLYYIVLEYVDGIALDRLLDRKPNWRPPKMIVPIAIDALRGLHAAHELSDGEGRSLELVHRDVTPGNVIVSVDGYASITDFGTAKARARATKTMPGVIKGKVGYVAPEVALGKAIDARADVFSMGVLLWNALTAETLYDTNDIAKNIQELLTKEVPPPSTVGLRPDPLFDIPILTALAREPHHRHQSAREMAESLSDALSLCGGEPPRREIGEWVDTAFARLLAKRRELADPDMEVAPVAPRQKQDATVPFRTVPAEGIDIDVDVATPDERPPPTAGGSASFRPPPSATTATVATDRPLPPRRLSKTAIIILILFTAFGIGLGTGLAYVFTVAR